MILKICAAKAMGEGNLYVDVINMCMLDQGKVLHVIECNTVNDLKCARASYQRFHNGACVHACMCVCPCVCAHV